MRQVVEDTGIKTLRLVEVLQGLCPEPRCYFTPLLLLSAISLASLLPPIAPGAQRAHRTP